MSKEHIVKYRIYYEDTDAGGVVYYANYLKFCERGRTEYLRNINFNQQDLMQQNIVFAVRKVSIDYRLPARLDDEISVISSIQKVKKASVIFNQKIMRDNDILCEATVVVACLDAKKFTPIAIPQIIMSQL